MMRSRFMSLSTAGLVALLLLTSGTAAAQDATPIATPARQTSSEDGTRVLRSGRAVEGTLTATEPRSVYTFEGEQGQILVARMRAQSNAFDTYLILDDAQGEPLLVNDDSGTDGLNSQIGPYALPYTGTYTLTATSYGEYNETGAAEGAYTVSIAFISVRPVEYTQDIEDELDSGSDLAFYSFRGQAGDLVNIAVYSEAFWPRIDLSRESVRLAADSTSSVMGSDTGIISFSLPATDTYVISVGSADDQPGAFTLTLDRAEVVPLAFDTPAEGTLADRAGALVYAFEGNAGDAVNLVVTGDGSLDTTLTLRSPDAYDLTSDDDTNGFDPAIYDYILPETGTYYAIVRPFSAVERGDFTLTLSRSVFLSLDDGAQTINLNDGRTTGVVTFTGERGAAYVLSVTQTKGGEFAQPSFTVTQSGTTLATASLSGVNSATLAFEAAADGEVYVSVTNYEESAFELSIERADA